MASAAALVGPVLFWWMSPIILGLVLSPILTSWSSRRSVGLLARRLRLFLIPAETAPEPELREMAARAASTVAAGFTPRPALPPRSLIPMIPQSLIRRPLDHDTVDAD
jgi:membrane glycosyltransferase